MNVCTSIHRLEKLSVKPRCWPKALDKLLGHTEHLLEVETVLVYPSATRIPHLLKLRGVLSGRRMRVQCM